MSNRSRRKIGRPLGARVEAVRGLIEQWRETRARRTHMPEKLWDAAVSLARVHGVWVIAQELRVNYESLKERLGRAAGRAVKAVATPGFVELDGAPLVGAGDRGAVVMELTGADGARLTIRLGGADKLDVRALADGFWSRRR